MLHAISLVPESAHVESSQARFKPGPQLITREELFENVAEWLNLAQIETRVKLAVAFLPNQEFFMSIPDQPEPVVEGRFCEAETMDIAAVPADALANLTLMLDPSRSATSATNMA